MHISVIPYFRHSLFPSFPRRRESRIRTNSVVFGPKFIRIPTIAGMTADLTTPPSTTTTRYEKTRSGLLLQLRTVHHGRLALVRCQLQNPPTSYLVGQRVVVVLGCGSILSFLSRSLDNAQHQNRAAFRYGRLYRLAGSHRLPGWCGANQRNAGSAVGAESTHR